MTPARCGGCGREISPEDVSCPHCGVTQPTGSPPSEPPAEPRPSSFRKPSPPRENLDAEVPSTFTPMHGLLALGALLIIAILWYGIAGRSGSENPQAPPAPPPASSPAPSEPPPGAAPAVPQLPAAERQAANDVLEGLKAVQSMAGGDVTFQDYTSRVLNTKVQVEKYLQAGPPTNRLGPTRRLYSVPTFNRCWISQRQQGVKQLPRRIVESTSPRISIESGRAPLTRSARRSGPSKSYQAEGSNCDITSHFAIPLGGVVVQPG